MANYDGIIKRHKTLRIKEILLLLKAFADTERAITRPFTKK